MKEITKNRFSLDALKLLHAATEDFCQEILREAALLAYHRKKLTLYPADLQLLLSLKHIVLFQKLKKKGDDNASVFKSSAESSAASTQN